MTHEIGITKNVMCVVEKCDYGTVHVNVRLMKNTEHDKLVL